MALDAAKVNSSRDANYPCDASGRDRKLGHEARRSRLRLRSRSSDWRAGRAASLLMARFSVSFFFSLFQALFLQNAPVENVEVLYLRVGSEPSVPVDGERGASRAATTRFFSILSMCLSADIYEINWFYIIRI